MLCPLYLTAYINGIYYYYCQDCGAVSQFVGAQDTRQHTTGVACPNHVIDPMLHIRSPRSALSAGGDVPVLNSDPDGLPFDGSSFDTAFDDKILLAPLAVVLDHHKKKKFKSKFKLSDGSEIGVRLFSISVSWVTATGQKTDILRVGQELEDPTEDPPGSDAMSEDAEDVASDRSVKFVKITLKHSKDIYHVLLL
jgi:hypothetical protein